MVRSPIRSAWLPEARTPKDWSISDFNGDGYLDAAVGYFMTDHVSVWYGDGMGGLAGAADFAAGEGAGQLQSGDFNGDGMPDIAVVSSDPMGISVLSNTADPGRRLPDTGQIQSYTESFGEDADYVIHPRSFTKLDRQGNPLPDAATASAMVRDNVTGLIWEVKTDDGSDPRPGRPVHVAKCTGCVHRGSECRKFRRVFRLADADPQQNWHPSSTGAERIRPWTPPIFQGPLRPTTGPPQPGPPAAPVPGI